MSKRTYNTADNRVYTVFDPSELAFIQTSNGIGIIAADPKQFIDITGTEQGAGEVIETHTLTDGSTVAINVNGAPTLIAKEEPKPEPEITRAEVIERNHAAEATTDEPQP